MTLKQNIGINDNILTLSTCYGLNDRVVMHAKLIKKTRKINNLVNKKLSYFHLN